MPALLTAITVITTSAGVEVDLSDVEEMRFEPPFAVERVTGDGAPRVKVSGSAASASAAGSMSAADFAKLAALAPGSTYPLVLAVTEPPVASLTASVNTALAYARDEGPSLITSLALYPLGVLTASDTNYRNLGVYDVGGASPVLLIGSDTRTTGAGGTGNWTAGLKIFEWEPVGGYVLAAGHYLLASWGHGGAGIAFPGVSWRIV